MKIIVFSFDAGIVSTLFLWCDECHRPKTGRPRSGLATKKTPCPPSPKEALKRESFE